ncbi:MAG TPA: peptide deformylase [Devosiaceae bacterium]|jgi:peptide deformylase
MALVSYPDPLLQQKAVPAPVDDRLRGVADRLVAAAREARAYGLAAAHIGEIAPIVVVNVTPEALAPDYLVLFNPEIIATATETAAGTEGSVSLPGVEVSIERPVWAEIAFDDREGQRRQQRFEGFVARCVLHEIEQVHGILFLMRLTRLKRDMVLKRWRKQGRVG